MKKKVLLVGGGGREHALAWKLAQSPLLEKLYIAPGNVGMKNLGELVPIKANDIKGLLVFALEKKIDLTFVGPDEPLALGIVDEFQKAGLRIFGPSRAAAEIEASKAFSKELMAKYNIPTAQFKVFTELEPAKAYVREMGAPIVVKASGLALGKGVFVCNTTNEAEAALEEMFVNKIFGAAGTEVVIEEFLDGPEISIHVLSDGISHYLLPIAQDHKTVFEGGKGPNTGGMGTIAPVQWVTKEQLTDIEERIVKPTLAALKKEGREFCGLLFPGIMMTAKGPKVLEFNARFGDPETESYMRLLKTDLVEIAEACIDKRLGSLNIEWESGAACCIILASAGYPSAFNKGKEITGIENAEKIPGVVVFQAGTEMKDGKLVTNGGRVLAVTAHEGSLELARLTAYQAVDKINFLGKTFRTDIGKGSLKLVS